MTLDEVLKRTSELSDELDALATGMQPKLKELFEGKGTMEELVLQVQAYSSVCSAQAVLDQIQELK